MEFIQGIVESYDAGTHTCNVRPISAPSSLLVDVPVAIDVDGADVAADQRVLVIAWPDAGAVIICPY